MKRIGIGFIGKMPELKSGVFFICLKFDKGEIEMVNVELTKMEQERLNLLTAVYTSAKGFDNMEEPYLVSNVDGTIDDMFNIQYMEGKGWIETQEDKGKVYVSITSDGVDIAERYLNSVSGFKKIGMDNIIANLILDKIDRKMA
ncbi:hypothetical protein V7129_18785 [Cytobacillus firmus]